MEATVQAVDGAAARSRVARDTLWLVGIYLVAVLVYVALGRLRSVPVLNPDEFIYGHLARGIADGTGFDWRGEATRLYALLYVLVITPAWIVGSAVSALAIAKVMGTATLCLVCVPVFLLARELIGPRLALLAAVLSLAGTWMTSAGMLLTENVSLPLATASLCALVMALRVPGSRWAWWALGFAVLAAFARVQVAVLVPVALLALGIDLLRHGSGWRSRAEVQRTPIIVFAVLTVVLVALGLAGASLITGSLYQDTTGFSVFASGNLPAALRQMIVLTAMAGFVPLALLVALVGTPAAWRDELTGPLLAVVAAATAGFVAQSGWFMHGLGFHWGIQRYVEYVVPIAIVATLVAATRWRELKRWAWAVPLVAAPVLLLGGRMQWLDELGAFAAGGLSRALGSSSWIGVAVAMAVTGSLALWIARREGARGGSERAAAGVGLLLLLVLLAQSAMAWVWPIQQDRTWRAGFPNDLRWLDKAAGGPTARLVITSSHPRWPTVDFFNRDVTQVYALESASTARVLGKVCSWTIGPTGEAVFDPACGPVPTRFYLDDPAARLTFAGQQVIATTRGTGRIVQVPGPPAVPKVRSLLVLPCDDRTLLNKQGRALGYGVRVCRPVLSGYFWLDTPATLVLGVRGGKRAHRATSGDRGWTIAPRGTTTIRIPLPAGSSQVDLRFDRLELPLGYPDVVSARLESAGTSTPIL